MHIKTVSMTFLDIDLKEASKVFSSKFSCGSSVTGDDEIVIQGDVSDDLFDFLPEKWPQVIKNSTKIDIIRIKKILKISRYEVSESYIIIQFLI